MNKKLERFVYRPELDGLRGIAIISVLLYHAQIRFLGKDDWISGGYIGVDIFFVLSGYLITNSILKELKDNNSFDFINFYQRRLRRILPMLLIVLIFSAFFAFKIFIINDLIEFARSGISSLYFGSNYFFHNITTRYGADSSLLKPLLHTWSLSIELQFYFIYPLIFFASYKFHKKNVQIFIFLLLLLSLQFSDVLIIKNSSLNYFHTFSRLWEFAFGSLIAYNHISYKFVKENFFTSLLPLLGLYLITYSLFFFDEKTRHPGFITPVSYTHLTLPTKLAV